MKFKIIESLSLSQLKREKATPELVAKYKNTTEFLKDATDDEFGSMWFDGKNLVGYCMANDYGWLTAIEVMPQYKGEGIGEQILDYAINNYGVNRLGVKENNTPALKLYIKKGFKEVPSELINGSGEPGMIFMTTDEEVLATLK